MASFEPLAGLRVVDLTQVLAGPYATYQLALMGAEIIKIEPPNGGDWARAGRALPGHRVADMGSAYLTQNANKKSVVLNLKEADGLAILHQLIAGADIFVENFRPGTAARLGLSFDDVKAINNTILYCSISAYGQDGPISQRPAYDHVVQAMCGIMTTTGTPQSAPNKVGAPYIDYATGLNAAFAISAALHQQRATGQAMHIDVAMLDSSMLLMASMLTQAQSLGMQHQANGNEAFSRSPSSGTFDTRSGKLSIAANNERQFQDMCKALERRDILTDPRWATRSERANHQHELRELISETLLHRTAADWEERFSQHAVPAARVRTINEVLDEPQLKARQLMHSMPLAGIDQPAHMPTLGFKVDGQTVHPTRPPPALGADTESVLAEIGIDSTTFNHLKQRGIAGCDQQGQP